ncbi:Peptidase-S9 domain-containing protein [Mycena kentingensis (nom. inval.)]|nr:Peptidase-S9 domain-containing protein [Mycena kentingensis (nom. inval.)]
MGCDKILGVACIAAASILLALVAFDVPYFKSIYFLRIDLSGAAASTTSQATPYIDLGVLGYCTDLMNGMGVQCSDPKIGYSLGEASKYINGSLPEILTKSANVAATALTKALVLHIVALVISLGAFVFALLALLGVPLIAECCADCFAGFAGATGFVVFIFDLAFFFLIRKRVNEVSDVNSAVTGNAIWLTLVAMILLFVTPIMFLVGRCCACAGKVGKVSFYQRLLSAMRISPQDIANVDEITSLSLSANGEHVVYCVAPSFRAKGTHKTSALWLAQVGTANSARQITSGVSNDYAPSFDPLTGDIFFLSDRHKHGGKAQVYRVSSKTYGGEAFPVTQPENIRGVTRYAISPDGRWLAYASADEPEDKDASKKDSASITRSWMKGLSNNILESVRTVVCGDQHVGAVTWSPDSAKLLYRLVRSERLEDSYFPISEHVLSFEEDGSFASAHVVTHKQGPKGSSVWPTPDSFFYIGTQDMFDAPSLYDCPSRPDAAPTRLAYGETDDAWNIRSLGSEFAVEVAVGLESVIDVYAGSKKLFTAFETEKEGILSWNSGWDMKKIGDKYILVVARSSGVTGEPENVWTGSTSAEGKIKLDTKLSSHHQWMESRELPQSAPFLWSAVDGTSLQGIMISPPGEKVDKLPTVVVPHGGPYSRDTLGLRVGTSYSFLLASNDFLVLCPNYRGSQGRGTAFSQAASGGMGTTDYSDCESMLDAAIERGFAHPTNVAIAGYSQGGFLSAWGITRPNARWKTASIGAAPTDWGSMAITSDLPDLEAKLGGNPPWTSLPPTFLTGSPIRFVKNVAVPVQLIHGEKDARVPLSQAVTFMRGLVREVTDRSVVDASELIIYPREDHAFVERAHIEDRMTRVVAHLKKYLL